MQLQRWGHTATTITLSSNVEVAVVFGGTSEYYQYGWNRLRAEDFPRLSETTILKFGINIIDLLSLC